MSRVLCHAQHIIGGYFGEESFQAITCTGINETKQTGKTPKTQNKQTSPM